MKNFSFSLQCSTLNMLVIFICLLTTSCGPWKEISVSTIEGVRLGKMDKDGIEAEIDVKINNPNNTSFTIYNSALEVKINDVSVGHPHLKKNVKIKANSNETYTFAVSGKVEKIFSGGGGLFGLLAIAMNKSVNIKIKGDIKAGKFYYKRKFPIDDNQKVPLFNP